MSGLVKNVLAFLIISVTLESCAAQTSSNTSLQKVVIIRHAEKPDKGDNLSCKGFNRSLQLPAVLYTKFKLPDRVFVPSMDNTKSANHLRMFETIVPFVIKYNLNINSKYDVDDVKDAAEAILRSKGYVLVVWEHDRIDNFVKALGAETKGMKWSDDDFDSIWILDFKNNKVNLSVDKENLNPANDCR
jgi:hypothetical protein